MQFLVENLPSIFLVQNTSVTHPMPTLLDSATVGPQLTLAQVAYHPGDRSLASLNTFVQQSWDMHKLVKISPFGIPGRGALLSSSAIVGWLPLAVSTKIVR